MLYETFDSIRESFGTDYFISRVSDEITQNLNPKFELREYQKEALGRVDFYFSEFQKRKFPEIKRSKKSKISKLMMLYR